MTPLVSVPYLDPVNVVMFWGIALGLLAGLALGMAFTRWIQRRDNRIFESHLEAYHQGFYRNPKSRAMARPGSAGRMRP